MISQKADLRPPCGRCAQRCPDPMLPLMWKPQLRRARLLVCLSAVSALAIGGGIAWAAVQDSSGVITGCYDSRYRTGNLRIIDASAECLRGETRITWNQQGQPGTQGEAGAPGAAGPAGPQGEDGDAGPAGV